MEYFIYLMILVTVSSLIASWKAYRLNERCTAKLRYERAETELVYNMVKQCLNDYLEMMDCEMDVIGKGTADDLKLAYAKEYTNVARNMIAAIRLHGKEES